VHLGPTRDLLAGGSVDDVWTKRLMELFYGFLWRDGMSKADALWRAKLALREEGAELGDWGAWILTGDPR
jgi:CHAT domain-containing protein